jgi:hypothetical protein
MVDRKREKRGLANGFGHRRALHEDDRRAVRRRLSDEEKSL